MMLPQIAAMYPRKKPTIWQIKTFVDDSGSLYFSRNTLKFFGQRASDFKVDGWTNDKKIQISAPRFMDHKQVGRSIALFDPLTGKIQPWHRE